jgi:hypothetical protein
MSSTATIETKATIISKIAAKATIKLPSDDMAKSYASQAFKEDKSGKALIGTAEQRMAFAIRIHMQHQANQRSNLPGLLCISDSDKKTLRAHLAAYFTGEDKRPNIKTLGAEKGTVMAIEIVREYVAMTALITRGTMLATICEQHDVAWSAFDTDRNCLVVSAGMLLPEGSTPTGRLAVDKTIALDGRPITFLSIAENGTEFNDGALANVKHLLRCCGPKPAPRIPGSPNDEAAKKVQATATPENLAKYVDMAPLILALHTKLVKDWSGDPIVAVDMPSEAWNAWNELVMTMDHAAKQPGFLKSVDSKDASKEATAFAKRNAA